MSPSITTLTEKKMALTSTAGIHEVHGLDVAEAKASLVANDVLVLLVRGPDRDASVHAESLVRGKHNEFRHFSFKGSVN